MNICVRPRMTYRLDKCYITPLTDISRGITYNIPSRTGVYFQESYSVFTSNCIPSDPSISSDNPA